MASAQDAISSEVGLGPREGFQVFITFGCWNLTAVVLIWEPEGSEWRKAQRPEGGPEGSEQDLPRVAQQKSHLALPTESAFWGKDLRVNILKIL